MNPMSLMNPSRKYLGMIFLMYPMNQTKMEKLKLRFPSKSCLGMPFQVYLKMKFLLILLIQTMPKSNLVRVPKPSEQTPGNSTASPVVENNETKMLNDTCDKPVITSDTLNQDGDVANDVACRKVSHVVENSELKYSITHVTNKLLQISMVI